MKRNWITKFEWLKENLSLILVLPTLIGGFWQLIELSTISTAYIRFFSISQVIPDGLLVLFVISLIVGSYYLGGLLIKISFFYKAQMPDWKSAIIVILMLLAMYSISSYEMYKMIKKVGYFKISDIAMIIVMITFLLGAIVNVIPSKEEVQSIKEENKKEGIKDNVTKKKRPKWFDFILKLIVCSLLLVAIYTIYFFLGIVSDLRKSYIETEKLINIEILKNKISEKHNDKTFTEILYFNDKYFFVQLKDINNEEYIRVFKIEDMFDAK